jgi:hypothetical protein
LAGPIADYLESRYVAIAERLASTSPSMANVLPWMGAMKARPHETIPRARATRDSMIEL